MSTHAAPGAVAADSDPGARRRGLLGSALRLLWPALLSTAACGAGPEATPTPASEARAEPAHGGRWIVGFAEPPVAVRFAGGADTGTVGTRAERMRDYAEALRRDRRARLEAIMAMGATVLATSEYSTNSAIVSLPADRADALAAEIRRLPGVSSVQPAMPSTAHAAEPGPAASRPLPR
jgi:hypothetical protein